MKKIKRKSLVAISFFVLIMIVMSFSGYANSTDLDEFPGVFVDDGEFDGYLVVGESAPAEDTIAMTNVALSIQNYIVSKYGNSDFSTDSNVFDSEISVNNNIISIGNPCNNELTEEIMGSSDCNYMLEDDKVALIHIIEKNGFVYMVLYGINDDYTMEVSKILREYKNYNLKGVTYYMYDKNREESDDDYKEIDDEVEELEKSEEGQNLCQENADCDDGDLSTKDECSGIPKACSNVVITDCVVGDGYCPADCDFLSDKDCECSSDLCNDGNPCTEDSCGIEACENIRKEGCAVGNSCIPIGPYDNNQFCSDDMEVRKKGEKGASCSMDYECVTGICKNEECINKGVLSRTVAWLKGLFR